MKTICFVHTLLLLLLVNSVDAGVEGWHHPLNLHNNGYWKERLVLSIENNMDFPLMGEPVELSIIKGEACADLAGKDASSVRVVNHKGNEVLFRIQDAKNNLIEKGPIPEGSTIIVPAECGISAESMVYIYYNNKSAWPLGEYYTVHSGVWNPGFEEALMDWPANWDFDWPEDFIAASWDTRMGHSGEKSICINALKKADQRVFGAYQQDLYIVPGQRYRLEAWLKGEGFKGTAGLSAKSGNLIYGRRDYSPETITLLGEVTDKWTRVSVEFTAPDQKNVLLLQTMINGKGKVWIDDIALTGLDEVLDVKASVERQEKLNLAQAENTDDWIPENIKSGVEWFARAGIKVYNFNDQPLQQKTIVIGIKELINRLYAERKKESPILVTRGTVPVPFKQYENSIFIKQDIAAESENNFYVYFGRNRKGDKNLTDFQESRQEKVMDNLVSNGNFDAGDFTGWDKIGEEDQIRLEKPGLSSGTCLFLDCEDGKEVMETGLQQIIEVEGNKPYFFNSWSKCSKVLSQTAPLELTFNTLRVQFLDKNENPIGDPVSTRFNNNEHSDYTWYSLWLDLVSPADAEKVKIKVISTKPCSLWFDDVIFVNHQPGYTSPLLLERHAEKDIRELTVWQNNSIVKVFPDDLPPKESSEISVSLAKNEFEPVQLALRSPERLDGIRIRLDKLTDGKGNSIEDIDIGIMGYVPIDRPTIYYRPPATIPTWHRKLPTGHFNSDGWRGWWPDPVLPFNKLDLPANETHAVWIDIFADKDAVPGNYTGDLELIRGEKTIKTVPIKVRIWDFTLSDRFHTRAVYGTDYLFRKNCRVTGPAKTHQENVLDMWDCLAEHRLNASKIYPSPAYKVNGLDVKFDFEEFDRAASYYFDTLKFSYTKSPDIFNILFSSGSPPKDRFSQKPYPGEYPYPDADRSILRPEYKQAFQSALSEFWNHMKEKGWDDKFMLYLSDEPYPRPEIVEQMKALINMIREVDPAIPIFVSSWWYRPYWEGYIDVWGLTHTGIGWGIPVPEEYLHRIKKNGDRLLFTTDGQQCTDTPYGF